MTFNIPQKASLAILILTYNEEKNLPYLLDSIIGWVQQIFMVDSGSTDRTVELAESYGVEVAYHEWSNHAEQFNWGLSHFQIQTDWVMRMDADEVIMPDLAHELCETLDSLPQIITGLYVKRRVYFMGRWIRHGSYYPTWLLRVFRNGKGVCEKRWMDEHIILYEGKTISLKYDIIDENRKDINFWLLKHSGYAKREMLDMLDEIHTDKALQANLTGHQDARKRWLKGNIYQQAPLFWRAWFYFLYRYIFLLGFLDGIEGLIFHVLQGFWYRFYIDVLIWEYQQQQSQPSYIGKITDT